MSSSIKTSIHNVGKIKMGRPFAIDGTCYARSISIFDADGNSIVDYTVFSCKGDKQCVEVEYDEYREFV
jgi:hypothetical protein